jgi:hypothetical protein
LSSLDEFFTSSYLEEIVFKFQKNDTRDYHFFLNTFHQICARLIHLLKALDIKKDQYLINFEEFIVERILESYPTKNLTYLKERSTPESWFYSLRLFLQSLRNLTGELTHNNEVSQRTYMSCRRLFHRELTNNPIILSLMKKRLIPKLDKVYQPEYIGHINSLSDKNQKKQLGLFFIFSFRIMRSSTSWSRHSTRPDTSTRPFPSFSLSRRAVTASPPSSSSTSKKHWIGAHRRHTQQSAVFQSGAEKNIQIRTEPVFRCQLRKNQPQKTDQEYRDYKPTTSERDDRVSSRLFQSFFRSHHFENYVSRKQKASQSKEAHVSAQQNQRSFFNKSRVTSADIIFDLNCLSKPT